MLHLGAHQDDPGVSLPGVCDLGHPLIFHITQRDLRVARIGNQVDLSARVSIATHILKALLPGRVPQLELKCPFLRVPCQVEVFEVRGLVCRAQRQNGALSRRGARKLTFPIITVPVDGVVGDTQQQAGLHGGWLN